MTASARQEPADGVRGERTTALVAASRSLQSRLSSILAAALMLTLGLAALTWYYAHALTRQTRTRQAAQSAAMTRTQGEMTLPPLGPISRPPAPASVALETAPAASPPSLDLPLEQPKTSAPLLKEVTSSVQGAGPPAQRLARSPHELALERRLSGVVFARVQGPAATSEESTSVNGSTREAVTSMELHPTRSSDDAIANLLRPGLTPAAEAHLLPTQRFLLPKGAFIDCTLETAIDSSLPGMTTCLTAADTFGADGKVVLLERGTKLVGETHGQVQQGRARVFVLWTQARTPAGVVVPLDSPGTDELGQSGLSGEVERHFWERFGAAMLVSLIDGAMQAGVQASNHSGGTVIYSPSGSQEVLTEVLKDTVHIAPTVVKHNGDRIQILVARDLDFRPVYELRASDAGR